MLELVRLKGATQIHHLKRKDRTGHVEYWKAQCGESRMLRLGGGKERKLLPIRTKGPSSDTARRPLRRLLEGLKYFLLSLIAPLVFGSVIHARLTFMK